MIALPDDLQKRQRITTWFARFAVGLVFAVNVSCALAFIFQPERYAAAFELSGLPGKVAVQGFGILFLIWNATYPPVLLRPDAQRTLFAILLAQQAIGLVGETWLWLGLPDGYPALRAAGLRFILYDGAGLLLMELAFICGRSPAGGSRPPKFGQKLDTLR